MSEFRHSERERGYARLAYQTFEPLHLIAYFAPAVRETSKSMGLSFAPSYFGFRGAPLGNTNAAVVTAAFYNWNPSVVEEGWGTALEKYDVADLIAAREDIADKTLSELLGEDAQSDALVRLVDQLNALLQKGKRAGRPLGAANLALPVSDKPHVALWQAMTTFREWRGDGHVNALDVNGLEPVEALVFHEATHPDPKVKASRMGRAQTQKSRRWSDEEWMGAAESLRDRGLVEIDGDNQKLTAAGADLYKKIEDETDDAAASIFVGVTDADEIFAAARPFVKKVIDSGFLPGAPAK
ncbi:hypothetical protein EK0264_11755 [Epidermidibacterium keratini]|uniref:Uncharacterized protein n=1 Tax=Epidermidibacterium keratini TaxID=1891644 RepID=A0A7L4YPS4_9ACTN|nr:hypothetical protein [Epidermidibacterium keratini]QHC00894.1 hypothetical protein EK0264_11755 [Epidermidibacterium keratini]